MSTAKYKGGAIYIMASPNRTTVYIGVTANLVNRVWQHRNKVDPTCFTARFNCVMLVYYKYHDSIQEAIADEKRIKGGSRARKEALINEMNPNWDDLSATIDM